MSSYFRSGVSLNNALAGLDGALWDICGKRANVPVYKMLGKVRAAVPPYGHASATELPALEDQVRKYMEKGYRHVRVQLAVPGFSATSAAIVEPFRLFDLEDALAPEELTNWVGIWVGALIATESKDLDKSDKNDES